MFPAVHGLGTGEAACDGLVNRVQVKWSNLHAKDNLSGDFYSSAAPLSHTALSCTPFVVFTFSVFFTAVYLLFSKPKGCSSHFFFPGFSQCLLTPACPLGTPKDPE